MLIIPAVKSVLPFPEKAYTFAFMPKVLPRYHVSSLTIEIQLTQAESNTLDRKRRIRSAIPGTRIPLSKTVFLVLQIGCLEEKCTDTITDVLRVPRVAGFSSRMLTLISGYEECFAFELLGTLLRCIIEVLKQLQTRSLRKLHFNLGLFHRLGKIVYIFRKTYT
jgi:hypothetical protein